MLKISINNLITCKAIPKWVGRITPEKVNYILGEEYTLEIQTFQQTFVRERLDYGTIRVDSYDGVVEVVSIIFLTPFTGSIGRNHIIDYDVFKNYTLKDIATLLKSHEIDFKILDSFASLELISVITMDAITGICFDFNWIEGKWKLIHCYFYINVQT